MNELSPLFLPCNALNMRWASTVYDDETERHVCDVIQHKNKEKWWKESSHVKSHQLSVDWSQSIQQVSLRTTHNR